MQRRRPGSWAYLALAACQSAVALIITVPNATTVWDSNNVLENTVEWALMPLTDPPPRSNQFTIWIRNGRPEIYSPALNTTIAQNVDFSNPAETVFVVTDAAKFLPGPAYQLFLADPDNANVVYCESTLFSIEPIGVVSPSSVPTSSSSSLDRDGGTTLSPTTSSSMKTNAASGTSAISTAAGPRLTQSVPGGVGDQGHNLFDPNKTNAGTRTSRSGRWTMATVALVACLFC
ncbi:hypothetical protein OIV83_000184 [Microbotryomycetes sp. JL201]|nr:hypothetical protein OIV83_000184 [Microbotryomycetes sp. JL201]